MKVSDEAVAAFSEAWEAKRKEIGRGIAPEGTKTRAGLEAALAVQLGLPFEAETPELRAQRREAIEADVAAGKFFITGEWLGVSVDQCTCYGGGPMGHEPGCGSEPVERLVDLILGADIDAQKRLYDVQAYLAKTLDNIEGGDYGWTGAEAVEFIQDALKMSLPPEPEVTEATAPASSDSSSTGGQL